MRSASSTRSVRMWPASCQPTTRRDRTSMTNAKNMVPSQQHRWLARQPLDAVAADVDAGALERQPRAPVAVTVIVGRVHGLDLAEQPLLSDGPRRALARGALIIGDADTPRVLQSARRRSGRGADR
jgi:hypothetical protein